MDLGAKSRQSRPTYKVLFGAKLDGLYILTLRLRLHSSASNHLSKLSALLAMTQHETPYVMPTAELSNTNRGSTKPDLSAGGIAVELGDVGYIYNGTLVKLFNALKGAGDMNNCHGLPSGHNLCIVDEIPYSMPLIDIPSKVAGVGDMKFTAG